MNKKYLIITLIVLFIVFFAILFANLISPSITIEPKPNIDSLKEDNFNVNNEIEVEVDADVELTVNDNVCEYIKSLSEQHNDIDDVSRHNIIFMGYDFESVDKFKSALSSVVVGEKKVRRGINDDSLLFIPERSLFTLTPFKENLRKFNFYYVDGNAEGYVVMGNRPTNSCHCLHKEHKENLFKCGLDNVQVVGLCNKQCSPIVGIKEKKFSIGYSKGYRKGKVTSIVLENSKSIFAHEFAHSFGGIRDEYIDTQKTGTSYYPNCVLSKEEAIEWWGDLFPSLELYEGCISKDTYRFHEDSLMKSTKNLNGFGIVNEYVLCMEILNDQKTCLELVGN